MIHNLAIIGYGGMGSWHHKNISERVPGIRVKGAYDIRSEAADRARKSGLYTYKSMDELLHDREIDIVTVATPNSFHKDICIRCLRAGKNVVCEKPVTLNSAELEEIITAANDSGRLFSVHQNRRWDRDYVIIKKILNDGTIGKPYFIESRVQGSWGSMQGWRGHKLNGGGMTLDWGVHLIDQMLDLVDSKVVSVYSNLFSVFSNEVEDNIKIILYFESGVSALLEMSTNCFIPLPRWHVSAAEGTAVIEGWDCSGEIVKLNGESSNSWSEDIVYTEAGPTRTMAPRPPEETKRIELPKVETDWACFYRNIEDVLDRGAELIVKPEQVLRVMKIIDLVFESDRTGRNMICSI